MNDDFRDRVRASRKQQQRMGCTLVLAIFVLVLSLSVYFLSQLPAIQREYIYSYPYRQLIEEYSEQYSVDSNLAAAVVLVESKFQNDIHSSTGAVGLMQLMPETAGWIAQELSDPSYTPDALHEPERNIRYGIWYLRSLEREFRGNDILALAAYNAGRGNVHAWMNEYGWGQEFADVEQIPYSETRNYVKKVLEAQRKYAKLYPKDIELDDD